MCQINSASFAAMLLKAFGSSPWGKVIWMGLVVFLRFHMVRLPSEWLHMNCLPSWCQPTEWIACFSNTEKWGGGGGVK